MQLTSVASLWELKFQASSPRDPSGQKTDPVKIGRLRLCSVLEVSILTFSHWVTSLDNFASSLSVSKISSDFRRAAATLASCKFDTLCHHSHRLSNDYWEEKQALYAKLDLNSAQSLRNEMQYCRPLNGVLRRKGWQIKFCLLQPITILSL